MLIFTSNYTAGTVEGPIGDLKTLRISDDEIAIAVSGKAKPDGSLYNPEKAEKSHTSGRLYKSMFVRHVCNSVIRRLHS
jgi:hypothetical protein